MNVKHIDPHKLSSCYMEHARENLESGKKKDLVDSIKERGIIKPIHVVDKGNGQYGIIQPNGGCHRAVIAIMLGFEKVPCIVKEESNDI